MTHFAQRAQRDALLRELQVAVSPDVLERKLRSYEQLGDHSHGTGTGPLAPGAECPGGDCVVHRARLVLAFLRSIT